MATQILKITRITPITGAQRYESEISTFQEGESEFITQLVDWATYKAPQILDGNNASWIAKIEINFATPETVSQKDLTKPHDQLWAMTGCLIELEQVVNKDDCVDRYFIIE